MPVKKPKKPTVSQLKKKADQIVSEYVRRSAADPHTGLATCYTCGVQKPWKEQQCGHYISRGANILRYDQRNLRVQCVGCNVFRKGNYPAYAAALVRECGAEIIEQLQWESKELKQWKPTDLQDVIDSYKHKLDELNKTATITQ